MNTPFKTLANSTSKDAASPFAQLTLKPITTMTPKSRHASTSSSTSSIGAHRVIGLQTSYQSYVNSAENAIIDDEEYDVSTRNDSTPLVSPNLLATSIDASSGRLLPSLSTISLLSLNRDNLDLMTSPNELKRKSMSRQTSFSSTARTAPFQIHQQRHQQYYNNSSYAQSRRTSQQFPQQPIPINNHNGMTPDTPTFGPTSLANSPSGFFLSQQQLPNSLQQQRHAFPNMPRHNSNTGVQQLQQQSQQQPSQPAPLVTGNMSPFLTPIPGEQVPMTPLTLSGTPLEDEEDMTH